MKHAKELVLIAGFVLATGPAPASERQLDRVRSDSGSKLKILLASAPRLLAGVDYEAPPPAPGIDGAIPPGPAPLAGGPPMRATGPPQPYEGPPMAAGSVPYGAAPVPMATGVPLYPCVKYKDRRHIAPCAVPMIVPVRDPCASRHLCSRCEGPKCVMVEICVPPCGCPKITCKHDGAKVRYDYGKYAVNITSRHGVVVVNYDD